MKSDGVAFLAIKRQETEEVVGDFARDMEAKFPMLLDPDGPAGKTYDIDGGRRWTRNAMTLAYNVPWESATRAGSVRPPVEEDQTRCAED